MANSYATGQLGNSMLSAYLGLNMSQDLIGPLDIFGLSVQENLPMGKDADTIRFEYYQELFDHDTYGNTPDAIVSRRTGVSSNGSPVVLTDTYTELQLGMFGKYIEIDQPTMQIKSADMRKIATNKMKTLAHSEIGKKAFATFNSLDGTVAVRFANGVADETLVIAEMALADINVVGRYFWNNSIQPIEKAYEVRNNYNQVFLKASYVLYVHDLVMIDVLTNLTAGTDYTTVDDYGSEMKGTVSTREECYIKRWGIRVVRSLFVPAATGVAVNATANMQQSGGVNVTYHNFMVGADAFILPSLGKTISVTIKDQVGSQKRVEKARGLNFGIYEPTRSRMDPHGITWGAAYEFWMGDPANKAGGLLLPSKNAAGTTIYRAYKIITTASA